MLQKAWHATSQRPPTDRPEPPPFAVRTILTLKQADSDRQELVRLHLHYRRGHLTCGGVVTRALGAWSGLRSSP